MRSYGVFKLLNGTDVFVHMQFTLNAKLCPSSPATLPYPQALSLPFSIRLPHPSTHLFPLPSSALPSPGLPHPPPHLRPISSSALLMLNRPVPPHTTLSFLPIAVLFEFLLPHLTWSSNPITCNVSTNHQNRPACIWVLSLLPLSLSTVTLRAT